MPRVTFTSGEVPTASKLNNLADQVIVSSTSAPSSPTEGIGWYDTNAAHPLVYVYNGSDWFPMPMGLISKDEISAMTTPFSSVATVNGSELTFVAEADQRYRYSADIIWTCTEADDLVSFQLQSYNGTTWSDTESVWYDQCVGNNLQQRISIQTVHGPGSTTWGWRVRIARYFGTGTLTIEGGTDVSIEHIGSGSLPSATGL